MSVKTQNQRREKQKVMIKYYFRQLSNSRNKTQDKNTTGLYILAFRLIIVCTDIVAEEEQTDLLTASKERIVKMANDYHNAKKFLYIFSKYLRSRLERLCANLSVDSKKVGLLRLLCLK